MPPHPSTPPLSDRLDADLARILRDALRAVDPTVLVATAMADEPRVHEWGARLALDTPPRAGDRGRRPPRGRTLLLAVGKAALGMTRGALHILADQVDAGVVVAPGGGTGSADATETSRPDWLLPQLRLFRAGHPVPDESGLRAARALAALADDARPGDRVLVLISGGASALLPSPVPGVELQDLQEVGRLLLESGLPIRQMNDVRGVLEELKAGGLARRLSGADVLGLVLSDVPGDDPAVVGSGPLHGSEVSAREVAILLRREGLWDAIPSRVQAVLDREARTTGERESEASGTGAGEAGAQDTGAGGTGAREPEESAAPPLVRVVGGTDTASDAAVRAARALGYTPVLLTRGLDGDARKAGRGMARAACALQDGLTGHPLPACLVASGETTVRVTGDGRGGRNQEVALGAASLLAGRRGIVLASVGTDGVDGPTDAAGGWVDGTTEARAAAAGFSVEEALRRNDAYPLLDAVGGLIRTGPTGTNVADLVVALVRPPGTNGTGPGSD